MVEIDDEIYLIATQAAKYVGVPRGLFYRNIKPHIHAHKIGARRRLHYRRSDLEQFRGVQQVA